MTQITPQEIESAANVLRGRINFPLQVGIVLGSGLSDMAERAEKSVAVPYAQIPGFPQSTVEGHVGRFVGGFIEEASVLMMQGRVHYYEGYAMQQVALGIRLMAALGVRLEKQKRRPHDFSPGAATMGTPSSHRKPSTMKVPVMSEDRR